MTGFDFDSARKSGKMVYLLEYDLLHDIQRKNKKPMEVVKELMGYGAILDTAFDLESVGTLEESPSNRLLLDVLYATALGPELIGSIVEIPAERIWTASRNGSAQPLPAAAPWPAPPDGGGEPECFAQETPGQAPAEGDGDGAPAPAAPKPVDRHMPDRKSTRL